MPQFARHQTGPAFYGWIELALFTDPMLADLLLYLQTGGMMPDQPGPGGIGGDGLPLPGDPVAWSYPALTEHDMRAYLNRQLTRAKPTPQVPATLILLEFEYREFRILDAFPALTGLLVDHATILADPLTGEIDDWSETVIPMTAPEVAPAAPQAFTPIDVQP